MDRENLERWERRDCDESEGADGTGRIDGMDVLRECECDREETSAS